MSFDRYSKDLAYIFIYKNEVNRRICHALLVKLCAGMVWFLSQGLVYGIASKVSIDLMWLATLHMRR